MAVAHSAASESHTGSVGTAGQPSFSWTHTQTGTPQGVVVFVHVANSGGNPVSTVTYGSVTLTRVSGGAAVDAAGERGRTDLFFAGSGLPTGNQTITVNRANTIDIMYASAATVTAATNTNVTGIVLLEGDGALTVQSVTDGGAPTNSLRYAAAYSGLASPPPAGTGSTLLNSIDFGNYGIALVRETTAGTGARNVGFNNATTDDRAAVHVAVRELWNRTDTETVASFTLTGNGATFAKASPKVITGETGAFTLTGQPADLRHNPDIEAGVGAFTLTGQPADTRHNVRIDGGTGTFSLTGNDATLSKAAAPAKTIAADRGQFTLTGNPATARREYALAAATGTFTTAGQPATLRHNPRIEANTGSFALSGGAPALLRGRYLSGGAGTFIETGQPATFRRTWAVQAATGAFSFTGQPSTLTKATARQLIADVGAFVAAGQAATLTVSYIIAGNRGVFSLTGNQASLRHGDQLPVTAGLFTLTGHAVTLTKAGTTRRRNVLIF